jgi:hypothetical protein
MRSKLSQTRFYSLFLAITLAITLFSVKPAYWEQLQISALLPFTSAQLFQVTVEIPVDVKSTEQ